MIFEISEPFSQIELSDETQLSLSVIEKLVNAHIDGYHLVTASRPVVERLLALGVFSMRQRAALQYDILAKASTTRSILESVSFTVKVHLDNEIPLRDRENQILTHVRDLNDPQILGPASILVEDIETDGRFYEALCHMFAGEINIGWVPRLNLVQGGGTSIAQQYKRKAEDGLPALCLSDSDRAAPRAPLSGTAAAVQKIVGTERRKFTFARILDVREVENLVPIQVIEDIFERARDVQKRIEFLRRIHDHSCEPHCRATEEFWRFVDLKDGYTRGFINRQSEDVRSYLLKMWNVGSSGKRPPEEEGDIVIPAAAKDLLEHVNKYLKIEANKRKFLAATKRSFWIDHIRELVSLILSLSIAAPRQRV